MFVPRLNSFIIVAHKWPALIIFHLFHFIQHGNVPFMSTSSILLQPPYAQEERKPFYVARISKVETQLTAEGPLPTPTVFYKDLLNCSPLQ